MRLIVVLLCVFFSISAFAKDDIIYLPIQPALEEAKRLGHIDGSIAFEFGSKSGKNDNVFLKDLITNKKYRKLGRSAEDACKQAFFSALIQFQTRAKSEGGKKVVNLTGYFKKIPYNSTKNFQCGVGGLMSGVTIRGDIEK